MKHASALAQASILALLIAAPAVAQDALIGTERLNDRIDDITEDAQDDLAEGTENRAGPFGVAQGFRGSVALSFSGTNGNTDTSDLSIGGRMTYGAGPWSHTLGVAAEFGEANGLKSEEKFFAVYDANRYFSDTFYVFATARAEFDNFATNDRDHFIGFGPGVVVVNNDDVTWRVQAGPGVRYVRDRITGVDDTEGAGILSSRFYYGLTDTVSLTNDTDVLTSSANTVVTNDIGVNFKVTNALNTRLSYRTEWNSDPAPGLRAADNTVGLSLVYGF